MPEVLFLFAVAGAGAYLRAALELNGEGVTLVDERGCLLERASLTPWWLHWSGGKTGEKIPVYGKVAERIFEIPEKD